MTQERKQFEHTFVLVVNDPVAWLEQARGMQIAAQPILQTFLSLLHEAPSRPGSRLQRLAYINAYMLLTGFAFENLLKAIAAKRDRLTVDLKARKLKFDKGLSQKGGHSLTGLGCSLNIEFSPNEHQYLRRLEEYVWWAGRYPVPLGQAAFADSHGARRLSFKTPDLELGKKLFDRLASLIERSV